MLFLRIGFALLHAFATRSSKALQHTKVRGTQACRSWIFEVLPWATSHTFLLQFVRQEQSGLSHLIQAIVGKPLLVPQWRQPARRNTLLYLILYILFWSGCKGGKVPSAHRHALYRASEPCSWTARWQAQSSTTNIPFLQQGGSKLFRLHTPFLAHQKRNYCFSICIIIQNICKGN